MSNEKPPEMSHQAEVTMRMWAVEQAVQFTRNKDDFASAGGITRVANIIYKYVTEGHVLR